MRDWSAGATMYKVGRGNSENDCAMSRWALALGMGNDYVRGTIEDQIRKKGNGLC